MQELEAHLAKARFARRHLSKMAGIGLAALVAALTMPKPAQAWTRGSMIMISDDRIMTGVAMVMAGMIPTVF